MNMDNIKLVCQKRRIGNPNTGNENIGYRDGI